MLCLCLEGKAGLSYSVASICPLPQPLFFKSSSLTVPSNFSLGVHTLQDKSIPEKNRMIMGNMGMQLFGLNRGFSGVNG